MWKRLTDKETLNALENDLLTKLPLKSAIELVQLLQKKDYSELLYVVIGMGHFRLSTVSYDESLTNDGTEIGISERDGKFHAGILTSTENERVLSCEGSLEDIVEFIDRSMVKLQYEK
ncbi:MAG: hypothetical protein OQK51_25000 [Kangiellaceae bacterium]|nr:hypothetical protein [Kangiellaceae bacterium]